MPDADGEGGPVRLDGTLYELVSKLIKGLDLFCADGLLCLRGNKGGRAGANPVEELGKSASSSVGSMTTLRQITGVRGDGENRSR